MSSSAENNPSSSSNNPPMFNAPNWGGYQGENAPQGFYGPGFGFGRGWGRRGRRCWGGGRGQCWGPNRGFGWNWHGGRCRRCCW